MCEIIKIIKVAAFFYRSKVTRDGISKELLFNENLNVKKQFC